MNITMTWLIEHDACQDARHEFQARFGDAEATASDVFRGLADLQRADWLTWLCNVTPEFAADVGELEAANGWQSVVIGMYEAQSGSWLASGSARVRAYDSASVDASGSARVEAYDFASVRAYDFARVRASGSASVDASGSATILLMQHFAAGVKVILHGNMACAIDRRDGVLKLLTAEKQQTAEVV